MNFLSSNRIPVAGIVLSLTLLIFSCKKEGSNNSQQTIKEEDAVAYSSESMEADASFDDIQDISMTAADEEGIASAGKTETASRGFLFPRLRLRIGQCADITVSPNDNTYPKTVTLDFGNGCIGLDGKFRKGKIIIHFTDKLRKPGSVVTITLVDFKLNRAQIEGTKVITNLSANGNINFNVQVTGGKVTYPNGRGYLYQKFKEVRQVAGGTTDELADDVYEITGEAKTTFNNGVVIVLDTKDALVKKLSCAWITEGTLEIKVNDRKFALDYGFPNNGDCDNKALLSWNNKQQVIVLP